MKSSIFRLTAALVAMLWVSVAYVFGERLQPESYNMSAAPVPRQQSRQEKAADMHTKRWNAVIPRYTKIQFAGGMGMLSIGPGWDYGKKKQWETDLFVGILPKFSNNRTTATITLKQNYIPWRVSLGGNFVLEPFETGLYVNKVLSRNFWGREPEKYGGKYYKFMTNTRINIFLGQRWKVNLNEKWWLRSVSFFYEVSSNDLYIVSRLNNKTIKPSEYLVFSLGLKFQIH